MKLLLMSDLHFGVRKNSETFLNIMKNYFLDDVYTIINKKQIDEIWVLGDLFHDRFLIDSLVKNTIFNIFEKFLKDYPNLKINLLVGNHDIYFNNSLETTSLRMFENYSPRLFIHKSFCEKIYGSTRIAIFPWIYKNSKESIIFQKIYEKAVEQSKKFYNYCFGHFEVNGFQVVKGQECEKGIDTSKFCAYQQVFSGHFHIPDKKGNFQYLGCPYEMDWNDAGDKKGIYVLDTDERSFEFIENTTSPKHIRIKLSELIKNPELLQKMKNNWVRLHIDVKISDDDWLQIQNKIELVSPLDYISINEIEGTEIDDTNVQLDDSNSDSNTFDLIIEYIKQTIKDEDTSDLCEYAKNIHEKSLKKEKE